MRRSSSAFAMEPMLIEQAYCRCRADTILPLSQRRDLAMPGIPRHRSSSCAVLPDFSLELWKASLTSSQIASRGAQRPFHELSYFFFSFLQKKKKDTVSDTDTKKAWSAGTMFFSRSTRRQGQSSVEDAHCHYSEGQALSKASCRVFRIRRGCL